ncbi:putative Angio-associated migratory cell protein [Ramicandelaber brevisporus]|nr:putative Angio-associated migratory cell protein [Ramicandelaber brevisporus]
MATLIPHRVKRARVEERHKAAVEAAHPVGPDGLVHKPVLVETRNAQVKFETAAGEPTGPPLHLPVDISPEQLRVVINELLQNTEELPYSFYVDGTEIQKDLVTDIIDSGPKKSLEDTITIVYQPQALFRVRSVSRCTASLTGHTEAVLCVSFSPDGKLLASGSGDTTVRIWDLDTETPQYTCKGHENWVLFVAWSPDGRTLASGGMDQHVRLWDPKTGAAIGGPLKGHKKWITCIAWEPFHLNPACNRMASASKDCTVRVWDTVNRRTLYTISQHTATVTCVRWGGNGLLYTASQDKTIKVWDATQGKLIRTLDGHAHWVNTLTLNTEYVLRTGPFDHTGLRPESDEEARAAALQRYEKVTLGKPERLISGSDDFTMYLWEPSESKKPITRLNGHQKLVNHVSFSPDGNLIASASFDNSVKLWDGYTGKFLSALRGHVSAVYQVCWSPDSRILLSASKDTTIKAWDLRTKKMKSDLPGHDREAKTTSSNFGGAKEPELITGGGYCTPKCAPWGAINGAIT